MRRAVSLFILSTMLVLSVSGCFDIEYAKDIFLPDKETPPEPAYQYYNITHTFVTVINDPSTVLFTEVASVPTVNETIWIDVIVSVDFPSLPDVGNETIKEILENLTLERYCNVTVYDENGTLLMWEYVNQTTAHPVQMPRIAYPGSGIWKVKVEASGIGFRAVDIYDRVRVKVTVHGPPPE